MKTESINQLRSITALRHVWLSPNPFCEELPRPVYSTCMLDLCTNLETLDSKPVDRTTLLGGGQCSDERVAAVLCRERGHSPSAATSEDRFVHGGQNNALSPQKSARQTSSKLPKFGRRCKSQPLSRVQGAAQNSLAQRIADLPEDFSISQVADLLPVLETRVHPGPGRRNATSRNASSRRRHPSTQQKANTLNRRTDEGRNRLENGSAAPGSVVQNDATRSNESRHPGHNADRNSVKYERKYPKGGSSAVVVRGDGSLRISWPNGDLALSCDSNCLFPALKPYLQPVKTVSTHVSCILSS
mmetsp:Transcript_9031/g.25944  ORF Transcript_9031/g.25944 Transcript_9031/m.25944 type:complete len:301 (+) Transcript_9031:275-1177(+)